MSGWKRRQRCCLCLALIWMAVIFWFSSRNGDTSSGQSAAVGMLIGRILIPGFRYWDQARQLTFAASIDFVVRKSCHAMEYAILAVLLTGTMKKISRRSLLISWLMTVTYAVSDEIHQMFVPGRACMIRDMMIDAVGAAVGIGVICLIHCLIIRHDCNVAKIIKK